LILAIAGWSVKDFRAPETSKEMRACLLVTDTRGNGGRLDSILVRVFTTKQQQPFALGLAFVD
jgi:hypothetical protein